MAPPARSYKIADNVVGPPIAIVETSHGFAKSSNREVFTYAYKASMFRAATREDLSRWLDEDEVNKIFPNKGVDGA